MIKNIRNGLFVIGIIATLIGNSFISIVNADQQSDLANEFKSIGNSVSPIQVQVLSDGSLYMLPTYATPTTLTAIPSGCSQRSDNYANAVINRPNGAIRVDCNTQNDFKDLLKNLKIANSITTYGTLLTDIYIPRYYIVEQETEVIAKNKIQILSDGSIVYDYKGTLPENYVYFSIFDPDFGNSNGNAGIYEGSLYKKDVNTPDLGMEAFALDGSRLSPETINAGVYTLEHYLSANIVDKTYDSQELFGNASNTLKYALNLYTPKLEEKVFREVCNERVDTDIYKNDTFPISNNLQLRYFLGNNGDGYRMTDVDAGKCSRVNGLRFTSASDISTYIKKNGSVNITSGDITNAPTLDVLRDNSLSYDTTYNAGGNTFLVDIKNTANNGENLTLKLPKWGVVGNTRDFTNQSLAAIQEFYAGNGTNIPPKKVKLYYLIKMTAYYPTGNSLTNKYSAGLDPMNPQYYNVANHAIGSDESKKYLLGNHANQIPGGTRVGEGDANYYVLLGTKKGSDNDASSVYMISAPGFAMKGSKIKSGMINDDQYPKDRMYDMHLNISQGFMETERTIKSEQDPNLYLLSPIRIVANDIGLRNPNLIFRNFEADEQDVSNSWGPTNMEQNLDYIASYKSDTSELPVSDGMLNSVTGNGLISDPAFETHFWYNSNFANYMRDVTDTYSCLTDINSTNFNAGIYNLAPSCASYTTLGMPQTVTGDNAVGFYNVIGKRYQQFQGSITKANKASSEITKGMLLQTIANMGDKDVYNQIYLNTNFVVGLPNKESIACSIDLYKLPVDTGVIAYASKLAANTNLTTDSVYSVFSNLFGASKANYVNSTVFDILNGDLKPVGTNKTALKNYMNTQYAGTEGNYQKWMVGEKGYVIYKCTQNGFSSDEVVASIKTSDKKYIKNAQNKMVEQASTNKLSDTIIKFNTGSSLGYTKVGNNDMGPNINGALKGAGYMDTTTVNGFNELTLGNNAGVSNGEIYLGKQNATPGYFKGGIEVNVPITTSSASETAYGRVDVLIYDRTRPGQILDQKTYYITTQTKEGAYIYAEGGVANWDTAAGGLSAINHTSGAKFGVNNASLTDINAADATTGLNMRIQPFNSVYTKPAIKSSSGYTLGEAACTALGVQCGGPTFNTNQDGAEFIDGVINSAGNTASPKISIVLKNVNGTIINSTAVASTTKQPTSFAYSIDTTGLKIIFPGNYQKLATGDYIEVLLSASAGTYTNASYNWMRTINASPTNATAFAVSLYDGNNQVSGLNYKNYNPVIRVNTAPLVVNPAAHGYCNVLSQKSYNASNNINQCLASGLTSSSNAISIEEDQVQGNQVIYTLECGNSGGDTFLGDLKFYISNLGKYEYFTYFNATNVTSYPNFVREEGSDQILLENIGIAPGATSTITVTVDLKKRNVSCPDTVSPLSTYARLSSSTPQSGLPATTNTVTMRECKLPTLTLNSVFVSDGNTANDKSAGTYASAYPFEYSQCGNQLQYKIDGKYECFTNDPTLKDINIKLTAGTTTDGKGYGREFINSWSANTVLNTSPVITGKTKVEWNLSGSTSDFNSYPSGNFSPTVYINPTTGGDLRLLGSKWTVTLPVSSPLKLKGFNGLSCVGNVCNSADLNSQIALDPTVTGQKIYDKGILPDPNVNTANLHKEEIDGTSKKLTKNGTQNYEPIHFEAIIDNPAKNQSEYGMNALYFNLGLNPNTSGYFTKVADESLSVPNITVENGEPMWKNQLLVAGGTLSYSGAFNVEQTLNTPFLTPANSLKTANGTPALKFMQDGPACSFTQGFQSWTSEIVKNPITIDDVAISDRVSDSLTPGYDPVSNRNFEQHLPGDVTNILVGFNNNSTTRAFSGTFVKITFDPTAGGKLSDVLFDFNKLFKIEGNVTTGWTVLPDGSARCKNTATELTCEYIGTMPKNQQSFINIPLRIDLESDFYNTLKSKADSTNWKYWFPVVISDIKYGTPDLNYPQCSTTNDTTITSISQMNGYSRFLVRKDGSVLAGGYNTGGILGNGNAVDQLTPVLLSLTGVQSVASSTTHAIFVMKDGTVKGIGRNAEGQLGLGNTTAKTAFTTIPGLTNVKAASVGETFSIFLLNDGTVKVTGRGGQGQLGLGDNLNRTSPTVVPGLTNVKEISAGSYYTLYLLNDGTVKATGANSKGQLGIGTVVDINTPATLALTGVVSISASNAHSLFLMGNGTVKSAGLNTYGQLGDNTYVDKYSPVNVLLNATTPLTGVAGISVGNAFSVFTMVDGTVKTVGVGNGGQLGNGSLNKFNSLPVVMTGISGAKSAQAGLAMTTVLFNDGTIKSTGFNAYGTIGDGTVANESVAVLASTSNYPSYNNFDCGVVYYTSDMDNIPAGDNLGDIETDDINIPANTVIPDDPIDGNYSFYVGIPYAKVETQFQNASAGNYSPGDVGVYTTKITNIGKALLKNPQVSQDLFSLGLNDNWINSEIYKVFIDPETTKTNIAAPITINFNALNYDSDPSNNVNVSNLSKIVLSNGSNASHYAVTPNTKLDVMPNAIVTINGSNTLVDGGSISVQSVIKLGKLKDTQFPQINCKDPTDCTRQNTNPKSELFKGVLDLPYVGSTNDAEGQIAYGVHFPILKSLLFAKTNTDYRPEEGSNTNIRGMLNSDNTTVVYRVDNFIPQDYSNYSTEKVGKARNPVSYIKLPSGVTYVPNSLKVVQNIVDGSNSNTDNTTIASVVEPTITNKNDYGVNTIVGQKSFDSTFLNNAEWKKVIGSGDNHFAYMKGSTFNVNFFNKGYNYYRITDDASLVLGYKQSNGTSFDEGQYVAQKKVGTLVAASNGTVVKFDRMKDGVILPVGKKYLNEKGEYDNATAAQLKVSANSTVTLDAGETIQFYNGLEGVTYDGTVTSFNSEVNTDIAETVNYWNNYTIISPIFAKLDLHSNPAYGVYEKIVKDVNGNVSQIQYQWNGVLEGTSKTVQVGVILYAGSNHNNIRFTYGNIDNTLNMNVISGLSNGVADQKLSPYNALNLGTLGGSDDIEYDASPGNVYQELVLPSGNAPDIADPVTDKLLMPQEKDAMGLFTKGPGKDNTAFAYTFNVHISTNDLVCGTEYTTSDGGNTLSWGRSTSLRSDKEDIDTFCFSSLKPTIKILDNGSYARGGYKSSSNNCTVNHLSLMGFNARAIGWNNTTQDGCWLTYNIQSVEKDLSMFDISPYDLLGKFKDRTDSRPIDTTLTMNSKHLELALIKDIQVRDTDNSYKSIDTLAPGFKTLGIKIISKGNFYIYGNDAGNNGYLLRTSDEGDHYTIAYKTTNKAIENVYLSETLNLIFFTNGTYIREVNSGLGPWSQPLVITDYTGINDVLFLNNTIGYIVGKSGIIWKTIDSGTSFSKINIKNSLSLSSSEELTKISNYLTKELWITTNRGSILYSNDGGNSWIKKTTGVTSDQDILTFEDGQITTKDLLNRTIAGSSIASVDTIENGSSIKFDNLNNVIKGKALVSNTSSDVNGVVMSSSANSTNLSAYSVGGILKGDLYLDIYVTNPLIAIDSIEISGGAKGLKIINPAQFNIDNSGNFKPGMNTIKVPLRANDEASKYLQYGAGTDWSLIQTYKITLIDKNKIMGADYILLSNLQIAPITNLTNIVSVYQFPNGTVSRNTTSPQVMLKFEQPISLSSYKNSNNIINGMLLFDIYVSNPTDINSLPNKLYIGNTNGNGLVVSNLFNSSMLKTDMSTPGWKTFAIPLNATDVNIVYTNKYDVNWGNIDVFKLVKTTNNVESNYVYMALDNVRYSSSAGTSLSTIYFFNSVEGIAFGTDVTDNNQYPYLAKYTTYDNTTWSMSELFNNVSPTKQPQVKGIKGRELYGVVNAVNESNQTILVTFYSLDKGINIKKHTENGLIMNAFDVYDSDYGLTVSSTNNLYSMTLVDD